MGAQHLALREGLLPSVCPSVLLAKGPAAGSSFQEHFLPETTAPVTPEQPLPRDDSRDGYVLSCPVLLVLH